VSHHAHLPEENLLECYLSERHGETIDPRVADHLVDCRPCAARYSDLASFMDDLRDVATTEADALFTPERLRIQQQQIARRLEHVGRPARILSFPSRFVRRTMTSSTSNAAPRWVAAAAATGLFIGVAVGASYEYGSRSRGMALTMARQQAGQALQDSQGRLAPVATRGTGPAQVAADDAFLSDLEVALERPHTRELIAFDALTPHVREVRSR
jgi:hypothetical protein